MSDNDLMAEVLTLFKQDYSPDPISGYLRLKYLQQGGGHV
jgi:hypothetical protein